MTEWDKAQGGFLYDANYDQELFQARARCADLCYELNHCRPSDRARQEAILRELLGRTGERFTVTPPFHCDYGVNISLGEDFYVNYNCVILDGGRVTFGDHVFIGPNCVFSTAGHPLDAEQRNAGLEIALPIRVGDNVWLGAGVTVLPGVTIGDNCVIGAGSVVTRDIPGGVVAAGSPCRVIRELTEADRQRYPVWTEEEER